MLDTEEGIILKALNLLNIESFEMLNILLLDTIIKFGLDVF